jgi:hypothetical protein
MDASNLAFLEEVKQNRCRAEFLSIGLARVGTCDCLSIGLGAMNAE